MRITLSFSPMLAVRRCSLLKPTTTAEARRFSLLELRTSRKTRATATTRGTISSVSVRYSALARHNRPRPWEAAEPGEISSQRQDAGECHQLDGVRRTRARQQLPQDAEHGLRYADRPHRSVEIAALVTLTFGRWLHAWQHAERAGDPYAERQRKVGVTVDLPQVPLTGDDRDHQANQIERRKNSDRAPGEGVADAPVERVGLVFGEAQDVGFRLNAGKFTAQSGNTGTGQYDPEPRGHAPVEAVLEQIERQRAGRDEEYPDPDRPVREAVAY